MRRLASAVGGASILAGLAHGGLAPAHFEEWWGYGVFFAFAAAAQALFGLAVAMDAVPAPRARRAVLLAGAVGNALLLAFYVWTRTVGVPFFGPEAGEVEAVAAIDVAVLALEALAAAGAAWLLAGSRRSGTDAWAPDAR